MRRLLASLAGLLVAGTLTTLLAPAGAFDHGRAALRRLMSHVQQRLPDDQLREVARVRLADYDRKVVELHAGVGRLADKLATARAALEDRERDLDAQKALLRRAKALLERPGDRFDVGGRAVTRPQVAADAAARLDRCRALDQAAAGQRKLVEQLTQAHAEGQANLARAKQLKGQLAAELEASTARLATARARAEVQQAAAALRDQPLGPDSELGRALDALRERAADLDRRTDYQAESAGEALDWSAQDAGDLTDRIARFLAPSR